MFSPSEPIDGSRRRHIASIAEWRILLAPSIDILESLAGTTEDKFLQIGSHLQEFYLRSLDISAKADCLVQSVSGEQVHILISRLQQMMSDLGDYLANARMQSNQNIATLLGIMSLLDQVSQPLECFQKMVKTLRMLGISTKIESSRLGGMGAGFLTLAMDVEKLSQMVSEKSFRIVSHRQVLASMINDNLDLMRTSESTQNAGLSDVLSNTSRSLEELIAINSRCKSFGAMISSISDEVTGNISEVVSSMQMHDMTRQQTEHIVEALKRLLTELENSTAVGEDHGNFRNLVIEVGDVCELQSAQLRHATSELYNAISSIIQNLRDIEVKQSSMAAETLSTTGMINTEGDSFMNTTSKGLSTITAVLTTCAKADREMAATLLRVANTMQEISGFVSDIENIGSEIDLIALNSQVKAAHTGKEGAALGVLAEAIKRLSVEASNQTTKVSEVLLQINASTTQLISQATEETERLGTRIDVMEDELDTILTTFGVINDNSVAMLSGLKEPVEQLTADIDSFTSGIDIHTQVRQMSSQVEKALDRVVEKAREMEPASSKFKENLRHMEEHYTMESERQIHEVIARGRSMHTSQPPLLSGTDRKPASKGNTAFGDNVDLF